ncbi:YoaK family protein [Mycobacterium haemophilum]|uniref:Membrane protein n=1 Tax=Mycobacterium haemophilum TaxID=29311 RepID=A0A0I9Y9X9_9MYCO|nr:YoaK family protein [Mycobacterium haemophilum]KLO32220.1 membrane protein [Mycobacterium haemophilum]KLO36627.1 membrane protein [Mycobacterium haemophilum]KLO42555.1 membrane protein [Mycobacterium haemophilum]KLO55432.1 membrane protein [Mycobacterium haemophilum]
MDREVFDSEARLSWVLAGLAGILGATAFTHSAGYFVTFMTGNAQRAVLGCFRGDMVLSVTAALLLLCFVAGVITASLCRRYFWVAHPHGPTVLTTFSLMAATGCDILVGRWNQSQLDFTPILLVVFGIGALNTSYVKDGEVSIPISYVTGTLVKMGQGIERHIAGGKATDWLGYFLLFASFVLGAALGGAISVLVSGTQMLAVAAVVCALTTGYTYFHSDRRALLS